MSESKNQIIRIIGNNDSWWCALTSDGNFEYGGTYKPDEAAQAFWDALVEYIHSKPGTLSQTQNELSSET